MIGALINALAGRSLDTGLAGGGLKFNFLPRLFQRVDTDGDNMARTSNFANVATVTRASKKTDAGGWDFTNGGTVGTLTEYASGVAAIHPTAGLLVEEGTTNEIRNPRGEGATVGVVGSGGAFPTNWTISGGTTREIIGTGTEDGSPYIDTRLIGTGDIGVNFEVSGQVSASDGQTWTASWGAKIIGGSLSNIDDIRVVLRTHDSGGAQIQAIRNASGVTLDGSHRRLFDTFTLSGGTIASVTSGLYIEGNGSFDITLRIYAPQLEQKAYPTSPVFPVAASPAAATRAADDVEVPVGGWHSDGSFTMSAEFVPNFVGSIGYIATLSDGTSNNTSAIGLNSSERGRVIMVTGGSTQFSSSGSNSVAVGSVVRTAVGYSPDDVAVSQNGETQTTYSSAAAGTFTKIQLGAYRDGGNNPQNGYIKDMRYWPKRLTNAELEAQVGN